MTQPIHEDSDLRPDKNQNKNELLILSSFTEQLGAFASTLTRREHYLLATIIMTCMDPIEKMRWRDLTKILDQDEIEILMKL